MPNNSTKILFLMTLISGMLISLCANSWMGAWMGLEINMLSFIPMLASNKNMLSTEASLKYFLIQAIASTTLLFMILLKSNTQEMFHIFKLTEWNNIVLIPLLMKVASAPFHWWLPSVLEGSSWLNCFILLSTQKMAPLMLISYLLSSNLLIQIAIVLSALVGGVGGFNQTSLRKLLAFSSVNHMSWMLVAMILGSNLWLTYFFIYLINILVIVLLASTISLSFISQAFNSMNKTKLVKFTLFIAMFSLGGLPPFLGFFPKWVTLQLMIQNLMISTAMTLVMTSLLTLFYYMRIMYATLMISTLEVSWLTLSYPKNHYSILLMTSLSSILLGILLCTLAFSVY
uniref:NADH-ubiquinone oxidoreductase chain 2 n=1 Tax=Pliacanthopus bimaculatus TaxID=2775419 RepID=A0A7L8EYY1_9NEOP|nr:NADH dehydrogenase subunit 2 [Pliacanthopus bimaculatus]QOE17720.1 NADH dehydrogenase subunit 2 [Pliacanthopus bimaculatus]